MQQRGPSSSTEKILHLVHHATNVGGVFTGQHGQALEQLTLFVREHGGDADADVDVVVSAAGALQELHALAAKAEHLAGLRAGRDAEGFRAIDRVRGDLRAQRRLRQRHGLLGMEIVVAAGKFRMLFDRDENVEVALRAAVESSLPLPGDSQARTFVDAGGNLDGELLLFSYASRPAAARARILDHFPRAAALRARSRHSEESL